MIALKEIQIKGNVFGDNISTSCIYKYLGQNSFVSPVSLCLKKVLWCRSISLGYNLFEMEYLKSCITLHREIKMVVALCKQFHYTQVIQSDKESRGDTFSMSALLMSISGVTDLQIGPPISFIHILLHYYLAI